MEETPLLQETADDVNGLLDLRSESGVWQEMVFDEPVQILGWDLFEIPGYHRLERPHCDAGQGQEEPGAAGNLSVSLFCGPGLSCPGFRFLGKGRSYALGSYQMTHSWEAEPSPTFCNLTLPLTFACLRTALWKHCVLTPISTSPDRNQDPKPISGFLLPSFCFVLLLLLTIVL